MNRHEHLSWCKDRALEYVETGDLVQAWVSMCNDLGKHEETVGHLAIELGTMMFVGGHLSTQLQMRDFIEGFN